MFTALLLEIILASHLSVKLLHRAVSEEALTSVCSAKIATELGLTTRGTAEQYGDCYKQTDMVVNSALNDITHLGYFHL